MHYHHIEDVDGELFDLVPFCSDSCHRSWCEANDETYDGWFGCQEGSDGVEWCIECGVVAGGLDVETCQMNILVVNRFRSDAGERCNEHHGEHWIQLPTDRLETRT